MYVQPFLLDNRISLRLVQKLSNSYRQEFKNFYFDRFGILDNVQGSFALPSVDTTPFLDACLERAEELSKLEDLRIAFSGGVDTTFLLALFKTIGKDVKLIHYVNPLKDKEALSISKKLMKFIKTSYDLKITSDSSEHIFDGKTYTGSLADGLFFPTQAIKGGWQYLDDCKRVRSGIEIITNNKFKEWRIKKFRDLPNLGIEGWCKLPGNGRIKRNFELEEYDKFKGIPRVINFDDEEIQRIKDYASMFHKPIRTNAEIVRLINFCFCYYQYLFEHPFKDKEHTRSFFDTQKFTNIAWTQYWDANKYYPPDKSVEYAFIRKVFGTDFGVRKNW